MNSKNPYLNSSVLTPVGIIIILVGYVAEALVFLLISGILDTKKKIAVMSTENDTENIVCDKKEEGRMIKPAHKPLLITVLTFVFILLFKYLGYTLTAPLYLFFFQLIYDDKLEHFPRKIITALFVTALVYILYVGFFNILFPAVSQSRIFYRHYIRKSSGTDRDTGYCSFTAHDLFTAPFAGIGYVRGCVYGRYLFGMYFRYHHQYTRCSGFYDD